jgi:hypothetical protein
MVCHWVIPIVRKSYPVTLLYHPVAEASTSEGLAGSDRPNVELVPKRIKVNNDNRLIGLWIAMAVLLGLFVGAAAGVIAWSGGHHAAAAMLTGGGAFGGTITLCVLIINTLRSR